MLPEVFVSSRRAIVLIVDDESLNLELLKRLVISDGHAAWDAQHDAEAVPKAQDKPDLILLDVMMPSLDGFEVCRCLQGEREQSKYFGHVFDDGRPTTIPVARSRTQDR
jgi:CheY-like chemotaxis protein